MGTRSGAIALFALSVLGCSERERAETEGDPIDDTMAREPRARGEVVSALPKHRVLRNPAEPSARAALDAFLAAKTVDGRKAHVQAAPRIAAQMREYYAGNPVEVQVTGIEYKSSSEVPGSERQFHIFQLTTAAQPEGFPVSVEETREGYKVDWVAFVQFHDNALGKFLKNHQRQPATFYAILERAHYFRTDVPDLGSKICLRVQPPIPGYESYAFVDSGSPLGEIVNEKFKWDHLHFPVVELEWVRTPDGEQFVELAGIVQDNWRSFD